MSRVGQISIARPGLPLQLKFSESELKSVLEEEAQPGDHITLYPGDYTTWWDFEDVPYDSSTEIEIRKGISVTILPGAKVEYFTENPADEDKYTFREEEFTHSGSPFGYEGETNEHPLSKAASPARRYEVPNFIGHIENIADTNLASEWAFESDLEKLREAFENRNEKGTTFGVTTETQTETPQVELNEKIQFRAEERVEINTDRLDSDDGVFVDIAFDESSLNTIEAGDNLEQTDTPKKGEIRIDHEQIVTNIYNNEKETARFIQDINVKGGHVKRIDYGDIATLNEREPRGNEGHEGDLWLVSERDFLLNLLLSTNQPDQFEGKEGDLWFVSEDLDQNSRQAGEFYISDQTAPTPEGTNGAVWLYDADWTGSTAEENQGFETREIEEVIHRKNTPTPANEEDLWATTEREVDGTC